MSKIRVAGGVLAEPGYFDKMNQKYTAGYITTSRDQLAAAGVDMTQMEYGEYQDIIVKPKDWPGKTYDYWRGIVIGVRKNLRAQSNTESIPDYYGPPPATRWDLLNAAIRKCFLNKPDPIPFKISPESQDPNSPDRDKHAIILTWGPGSPPVSLEVAMICPYDARLPIKR